MLKLCSDAPVFGRETATSVFAGMVNALGWKAMPTIVTVAWVSALPPDEAAGVASAWGVVACSSSWGVATGVATPSGTGVTAPWGTLSAWTMRQTAPCGFAYGS